MATGDIKSVSVNTDGWSVQVVVEGWATRAGSITYDFGSFDDTPATITDPKMTFTVVSQGYSATGVLGTITRTVYGTHVVRKAYPDQASKDEVDSGADITIRVALSESIYDDDKVAGSGTDPVVTVAAGWATYSGTPNPLATAMTVTNNSTLDYPKCIAQWAFGHTPAFRRVTAAFDIGCIAYHGHGIACVALSAAGAITVSGNVTSKTAHLMSASGLYYESYDLAVPVTSMTDGNDITLKFIAYPLVGDADSIIDTSTDTVAANAITGKAQITTTYKTTATSKYVATTGNDTTGDGSTGNPYLTIGKALAQSPDIVYVKAGSYDILGSTPASVTAKNYAIEVRPDTGASVTLARSGTWKEYKAKHLAYIGVSITWSSGNGWLDGTDSTRSLYFDNCSSYGSAGLVAGIGYRSLGVWWLNCALGNDLYGNWFKSTFCGVALSVNAAASGHLNFIEGLVACLVNGNNTVNSVRIFEGTSTTANFIGANNKIVNTDNSANSLIPFGASVAIDGFAFIGNVVEVRTGTQPVLWVGADSSVVALNNVIVSHNTTVGNRCNLFYNDAGVAANVRTNIFCRNNAFNGYAIKSDTFGTPNANRVGNWPQLNGVNYSDNRYTYQAGLNTFANDYNGINVKYEDTGATIPNELGFTDDNSAYGDATGNGDYMPTEASALYDHTLRQAYQSYDLYGVAL